MTESAPTEALAGQPIVEVERDGVHYTLLGSAHVSRASVEAVDHLLDEREFDAVAVELCGSRMQAMTDPKSMQELDLYRVIREGKTGLVAANLALSAYQRRLAEQLGVEPGAEMRAAFEGAKRRDMPVWEVDRDVGTTLRRTYAAVGFWGRIKIVGGLLSSVIVDEDVDEQEIEKLKQGDILESTFSEFAQRSEPLYRSLIHERDRYMAASLRKRAAEGAPKRVLAVVGAGHLKGLAAALREEHADPQTVRRELEQLPPPGRWGIWLTIFLSIFVLGGFAFGFLYGKGLGTDLVIAWVLATGTLGAIGCALAGGHPFSIIAAFVASPLTPLHPALASGTISALVEISMRRPKVSDFSRLRDDVVTVAGWWRNRVARVMLNFFLTSLGTGIGVYIGGGKMIGELWHAIFG